ncbi:hypothetical protein [Mycobacterium sp.]|uniref:hypothetical protein n=1 Tax=Mycobacterium sp. TaxID=1785 RepID=UPI002BE0C169|nr:hypothetical protein [Mycobacterium sp.]HTY30750.1 hypothetical protein [Mycobacterium sp.]
MSTPIAAYSFLPWIRQGIANAITAADNDPSVAARATIHIELGVSGDAVGGGTPLSSTVAQDFALYGPGDVVGIKAPRILRTEPRDGITNFEPNYLAAVDFYDEDAPWRMTPCAPDASGLHLRPWLTLIVLADAEFTPAKTAGTPMPYITVTATNVFPPADELWAWAHVHVNDLLSSGPGQLVATDVPAVIARLETVLQANRDAAYSRLVCPRQLQPNTSYHAFVIPTFETGRLAGLFPKDSIPSAPNATFSAWAGYQQRPMSQSHPYFYSWSFTTGDRGDFEYLVRLLKPQPVDPKVGHRDINVQDPGSNLPGITNPALNGILRLGGALQIPGSDQSPDENWDQPYPDAFQSALAAFINLPDTYASQTAAAANAASGLGPEAINDPDPLITAPLYGQWHSLTSRLLTDTAGNPVPNSQNWVHRLNLDPRFRVPAAFGTSVVETNTETYMNDAWEQIGDVLAANSAIRRLHLAIGVASRWHQTHLQPLATTNNERAAALLAPVSSRVMIAGKTLFSTQSASIVPPVLTSPAFRRAVRPGARLMRTLPFNTTIRPDNMLARVAAGAVSAAPPKAVPTGLVTVDQAAAAAPQAGIPGIVKWLLTHFGWLPKALRIAAIVLAIVGGVLTLIIPPLGIVLLLLATLAWFLSHKLAQWQSTLTAEGDLQEANQTPQSVDQLPTSSNFVLELPGATFRPTPGGPDNQTATRFKTALKDACTLVAAANTVGRTLPPQPIDFAAATTASITAVTPSVAITRRGLTTLGVPAWIIGQLVGGWGDVGSFDEVMAYPKIDVPMYLPLKAISVENFLPGINYIAPNSITLVETNQRFIEAYMVGLNHEFARKLLWREYPTDQRGSYFRQFWDVQSYIDPVDGLSTNPNKEKLYDIPELHRWPLTSALGEHNNRLGPGETPGSEQAVLVIRGELLKKYPNTMIYAQRAKWQADPNGRVDVTLPRLPVTLNAAEEDKPPRDKLRSPLYEATAYPDIYFFGFDLTIPEAKGGPGTSPSDDPGWFFVLQQRPGEPRFGLETDRASTDPLDVFDILTWQDTGVAPGDFLPAGALATPTLQPPANPDRKDQHDDDVQVATAAPSSARWAYLLFRSPVRVDIHAAEMLAQAGV